MKPDRKHPARAPAMSAPHNSQESSQESLQGQDWYVIADEGELTLRISNGLRVGEDRWGELTLNHPLSAHRWLEFSIDADGELWCHSSRKDIVVRSDGEVLEEVMLDPGVSITLPHNLLHISNHIRRGSSNWQIEVGLLESDPSEETHSFDDLVDTQDDLTVISEPGTSEPGASDSISGTLDADSEFNADTNNSLPANTVAAPQSSANDSVETYIPTLETVVVAPRDIVSDDAGPAIERAVAKLKNRSKRFGEQGQLGNADSTESALVPVDADGPFHTDEIRAALRQPINVSEPNQQAHAPASVQVNQSIYTPSVTTSIVPAVPNSRLRLVAGVAIGLLLLVGAALLVAINAAPDDQQQRSLAGSGKQNVKPSTAASTAPQANDPTPPVSSASRTNSLLKTASALLSNPDDLQPDTLDFAVRSLNLVLAAQPQNLEAQRLLASAQRIRIERNSPVVTAPQSPVERPSTSPVETTALPSNNLNTPSSYRYTDPRLAKAAQLIAQGAILAPRNSSAVSMIMRVLAEDPGSAEAVRLLNRSASVLVAQADEEYETLGVYAARNTLEEVLSFHPKHGPANQRWRSWVVTGSPTYSAPPVSEPNLESGILEPETIEPQTLEPQTLEPQILESGTFESGTLKPSILESGTIRPEILEAELEPQVEF